jgi:signal transduction histidine kinase/ActR/RegA family two-component response regulator
MRADLVSALAVTHIRGRSADYLQDAGVHPPGRACTGRNRTGHSMPDHGNRVKLLLVSTSEDDLGLVRALLAHPATADWDLDRASGPGAAIEKMAAGGVSLCLLDWSWGADGARSLMAHALRSTPPIPAVVLLPEDDADVEDLVLAAGALDCVVKSQLDPSVFRRAVKRALNSHRVQVELRQSQVQLQQAQKMEAIGRLAGGVAHDFNNLLTAMLGYSELLLDQLTPDDSRRREVEEIRKAAERAVALTRQLLAFSRKQAWQPKVLDLNQIVVGVDKMLQRLIGEDIALQTLPEEHLWPIKADAGQVEQVIMNLAVNARDAMPDGGRLTIETCNVELDAEYVRHHATVATGSYVMLAVSDNGCGMSDEVKAHLFEPFYTTKERGKGTGLGLATVYGIVKKSGGHVWAYSELGVGTTFKAYFPRVTDQVAAGGKRPPMRELPTGTETILLVEDEDAVRRLTREVLGRQGYRVLDAGNGAEALAMWRATAEPVHLLVTDLIMPEMNGRDLVSELSLKHPALKVLYISGYTDRAIVLNGTLAPNAAFLQKPFTPEALTRAVRQVLDGETKA